jgi:hypothetical protein
MAITTGDATDGVRTGLAGRIANKIVIQDGAVTFPAGQEHTKGLNALADGIVDALNTDKVDSATQTTGGGGGGGSSTTLHDRTGKIEKEWGLSTSNTAQFIAFWTGTPVGFGAGSNAIDTSTLTRWFLSFSVNSGTPNSYGIWWGGAAGWCQMQGLPKFTARCKFLTITPNIANGFALCGAIGSSQAFSTYTPTIGGTNADTSPHISISIDSRVNGGKFIFGTGDGVTANWIDTGVTCNTTDEFLLCIDLTTAGTAKCTITNCTSGAVTTVSLTTHLPSSTLVLGPELVVFNNQASPRSNTMLVEYVYMDQAA